MLCNLIFMFRKCYMYNKCIYPFFLTDFSLPYSSFLPLSFPVAFLSDLSSLLFLLYFIIPYSIHHSSSPLSSPQSIFFQPYSPPFSFTSFYYLFVIFFPSSLLSPALHHISISQVSHPWSPLGSFVSCCAIL